MGAIGQCCCYGCELGTDDFNRADSNPVSGSWHEFSGNWAISGNKLTDNGGAGVLATTICHPTLFDKGAWIAEFDLVECRTKSTFIVGAGNPGSSPYRVTFEFSGMDTGAAKIRLTIDGDETVYEDYNWPGGYSSNDTVSVYVCYEPGAKISSFIEGGGFVGIYACCNSSTGANCFSVGGVNVGGFFFVQGSFDNWVYTTNHLDDSECDICGCLCLKAYYPDDRYEPIDYGCFPKVLKAIFQLVTTPVPGLTCFLDDFEVDLPQVDFGRNLWRSEDVICGGLRMNLTARCVTYEDAETGMNWRTLRLELLHFDGVRRFYWTDLNTDIGDTELLKWPDFELSTCNPLSLVYKSGVPTISATSAYPPGSGWYVECCTPDVSGSQPEVKYHITVVPA